MGWVIWEIGEERNFLKIVELIPTFQLTVLFSHLAQLSEVLLC
jgi:hypothetical protein